MAELLSLKWNNHISSFLEHLYTLRKKNTYTDVTLACEGKVYHVHKMVLSTCSDYFSNIFHSISAHSPVIILKDMSSTHLELLLDYMYLGEVNVRQIELASLIQAAQCLRLKGLAFSDETHKNIEEPKILSDLLNSSITKKPRISALNESTMKDHSFELHTSPKILGKTPLMLREEHAVSDLATIKEERPLNEEYTATLDYASDLDNDSNENIAEIPSKYGATSSSALDPPFETKSSNETSYHFDVRSEQATGPHIYDYDPPSHTKDSNDASHNFDVRPAHATGPHFYGYKTVKSVRAIQCCPYCKKKFNHRGNFSKHIRIHTGEKPFACHFCPYRASQKGTLAGHMLAIHKEIENTYSDHS